MLLADLLARTSSLELALLAAQILLCCLHFLSEGVGAVNHATEVDLGAVVALVEGTAVQGVLEELAMVVATFLDAL